MENTTSGNITNFYGPITVSGGNIGAIGGGNIETQNINSIDNIENFYKAVSEMDTEALNNDKAAMELVEEIKSDAKARNMAGVLEKLKKMAVGLGSSVFANMVSSVIIEFMKVYGYFPF